MTYRTAAPREKEPTQALPFAPLLDFRGACACPACGQNNLNDWPYERIGVTKGTLCEPSARVTRVIGSRWWGKAIRESCNLSGYHLHQECKRCGMKWAVKVKNETLDTL